MKNRFSFLLILIATSAISTAKECDYSLHVHPVTGEETAVLVLAPGMNGDGRFFLGEAAWVDFATEHQLGIIALAFRSAGDNMYNSQRRGYYWPEQGSGDALLDAIRNAYGKDLPILIYGFSGGAHFTSRFTEWVPERVQVWAAYSAQFWDSPVAHETMPPGIVACGEYDGPRWFPSFAYFYEGRMHGKPWTWVSISQTGHARNRAFEQFVRDYFATVLSGEFSPVYVDVDTLEAGDSPGDFLQPELLTYLPSKSLKPAWLAIHELENAEKLKN